MDKKKHLICRKGAAGAMTAASANAEARLIQPAPARRYRVGAVESLPFLLDRKAPATGGERAALHLPAPSPPRPRDKPGGPAADGR